MTFIALCGFDGSGKTTVAKLLKEKFRNSVVFSDPPKWSNYRNMIATSANTREQLFLFLAARSNTSDLVQEALDKGKVVIADRWTPCTIAYQGYGHGLDLALLESACEIASPVKPTHIAYLYASVSELERRVKERANWWQRMTGYDAIDKRFASKVIRGYEKQAVSDLWGWFDTGNSPELVAEEVYQWVLSTSTG